MKRFTMLTILVLMVMFVTVPAFAGPIDWIMDKVGYTPTSAYDQQVVVAQQALAAAKASQEASHQLQATAAFQENIITYGGISALALGALVFFRRKDPTKRS